MSLRVLDGLVAWRRSLAGPGGPLEGIGFSHHLQEPVNVFPNCLITDLKQEADTDIPVCVRFTVTEALSLEVIRASQNDAVQALVERLRQALSGNNLDGLAKTDRFVLHNHLLRGGPLKRGRVGKPEERGGTAVTLRWTAIASWRP